jgi:hypothetical protein
MTRNRQSWVLVFLLVATAAVPMTGAAITADIPPAQQTAPNASTVLNGSSMTREVVGSSNESCTETIDSRTAICSASVGSEGRLDLVVYSEVSAQEVTITDSGDFMEGGDVSYIEPTLREGRNRIRWSINTDAEATGVGISTPRAIHSKWIEAPTQGFLPGHPNGSDPLVVGSTVLLLFSVGMPIGWKVQERISGGEEDVA